MKYKYLIINILLITHLLSCKKDIPSGESGNGSSIKVNYLSSSDVIKNYSIGGIGIFVDTAPFNTFTSNGTSIPYFSTVRGQIQLEFPKVFGASGLSYIPYFAGSHRFRFGYMAPDSINAFTGVHYTTGYIDTTFNMTAGSEALLYLIDAPPLKDSADPRFKLVKLDAERFLKLDSTQVAVRLIHQSPDTEPLRWSRVKPDGSFSTESLPQHLEYGGSTSYLILNTREAKNGLTALRIYSTVTGNELLNTAVPAHGGHAYTLAVTGFQQPWSFRIPVNVDDKKNLLYDYVSVAANLRAEIRQIW